MLLLAIVLGVSAPALAIDNPQSGGVGVQGTISSPPPTTAQQSQRRQWRYIYHFAGDC